jgi:hypothetical protein
MAKRFDHATLVGIAQEVPLEPDTTSRLLAAIALDRSSV